MKFAYFVTPHTGGTYSLFRYLRRGLAPRGIDVEWLGMANEGAAREPVPTAERSCGTMVGAPGGATDAARARALLAALSDGGYDGVFVNVLADRVQMNIARYLPRGLFRIMIVHNITPGTYAAAHAIRDHVHATVGVSERCGADLVHRFGFSRRRTVTIPNAVDIAALGRIVRPARPKDRLRLIFLGRVEDTAKGVFWLPRILKDLPSAALTVAGDGPDLDRLKARLSGMPARFLGKVAASDIPPLLAAHDVLVMPSRFEGLSLTLVEAMAAGCVPVASCIRGVTDTVVEHGADGLLFPVGDWRAARRHLALLGGNRALLEAMSRRARAKAGDVFNAGRMAADYARLIEGLCGAPPEIAAPLPMADWAYPAGMRPALRTLLPAPVKNFLREARERL